MNRLHKKPQNRDHEKGLAQVTDYKVKNYIQQKTGGTIRHIDVYKEQVLGTKLENYAEPDIIAVYLADTYRIALIEAKSRVNVVAEEELTTQTACLMEERCTLLIKQLLLEKKYPRGVVESMIKKGVEVYGVIMSSRGGLRDYPGQAILEELLVI